MAYAQYILLALYIVPLCFGIGRLLRGKDDRTLSLAVLLLSVLLWGVLTWLAGGFDRILPWPTR
jgi:hypothetical protein